MAMHDCSTTKGFLARTESEGDAQFVTLDELSKRPFVSSKPESAHHRFKAPLLPPLVCLTWALLPLNRLCQIKASLSKSSMSFSVHSLVGSDCKNIMISWKSMCWSLSDHLTRKAAQT